MNITVTEKKQIKFSLDGFGSKYRITKFRQVNKKVPPQKKTENILINEDTCELY